MVFGENRGESMYAAINTGSRQVKAIRGGGGKRSGTIAGGTSAMITQQQIGAQQHEVQINQLRERPREPLNM